MKESEELKDLDSKAKQIEKKSKRIKFMLGALILINVGFAVAIYFNSQNQTIFDLGKNSKSRTSQNTNKNLNSGSGNGLKNTVSDQSNLSESEKSIVKTERHKAYKRAHFYENYVAQMREQHQKVLINFIEQSKMIPVVPEGYLAEPVIKPHPKVSIVKAKNLEEGIVIHTAHSAVPIDKDMFEYAASKYLNQDYDDFEKFDGIKLENPAFSKIDTYIIDSENPVIAIIAQPKNKKNGESIAVTVYGDGKNIKKSQAALIEEFKKIKFR